MRAPITQIKQSLQRFYDDEWWGVSIQDKEEMTALLTQWGDRPQDSCPDPPEWPDFTQCMSRPAQPLRAPQPVPQRPPPLVAAPYQPLGFRRRRARGTGRARGRARGSRARGRRRGRRGRGRAGRNQGTHRHISTSSSEAEMTITRGVARRSRRRIICSSTSSTSSGDDEVLNDVKARLHKYPIGTGVRKKFDSGWFDGKIVKVHVYDKLWTVRYTDGDVEDLDEDQLIRYSSQYNQKYNTK